MQDAAGAAAAYSGMLELSGLENADRVSAHSNRAVCHLLLGDFERCLSDCDMALGALTAGGSTPLTPPMVLVDRLVGSSRTPLGSGSPGGVRDGVQVGVRVGAEGVPAGDRAIGVPSEGSSGESSGGSDGEEVSRGVPEGSARESSGSCAEVGWDVAASGGGEPLAADFGRGAKKRTSLVRLLARKGAALGHMKRYESPASVKCTSFSPFSVAGKYHNELGNVMKKLIEQDNEVQSCLPWI